MDFEDILQEVGDFGYFQKRILILYAFMASFLLPLYCMTTIFMISSPPHWCKVNQLSNLSFELQKQLISPVRIEDGVIKYDSCNMFDIDYNYLAKVVNISTFKSDLNITSELSVKPCDNGWAYDNSYYDETAVTALDLVCDRQHFIKLILSTRSLGTILGTPIFSWLSDKIGRKKTFQIIIFVCIISSLSPILFRDLYSFITFRTINGLILPAFYQMPYIILIESVGPRARSFPNSVACLAWVTGLSTLSLIAFLTRNWVILHSVTSATIAVFFFYWKVLPESPRWLLVNEKYTESEKLLTKMAELNGKPKPEDLILKLKRVGKSLNSEKSEKVSNAFKVFLMNSCLRNNFLLVTTNWMSCAAVYYGIHMNLYNFSGNEFLNSFLLAIIEFPSYFVGWYCIETRLGRRWSYSLFSMLCGISLCVPAIIPDSYWILTNASALFGKFCGTISFMIVYQQAAEVYPTPVRNQGMGMGSIASSVVGVGIPFIAIGASHVWIPLFFLGLIAIFVGLSSTLLPETLNVNLPQTVSEGNNFGKKQEYFSWANTKTITKISEIQVLNENYKIEVTSTT